MPTIFEFPFSRYMLLYFSDVSTSSLTSFFTVVPKGFTTGSNVHVAVKLDLSILFKKHVFQKTFWPFSLPLGGFCPPFSNSPSHVPYPQIFSQLSTLFTLPSSGYPPPDDRHAPYTNRGDQPTARRPYMAHILYYTLNLTSIVSPSP